MPSTDANSETTMYLESSGQSVNKIRSETSNLMGGDEVSCIGFPWFRGVSEVSADPQPKVRLTGIVELLPATK